MIPQAMTLFLKTIRSLSHSFKLYVYKSREEKFINENNLMVEIRKVKRIENDIALTKPKKTIAFTKKWHIINNIIP